MVDHASFASCGAVAAAGEPPRSYSASYSQASPSGDGGPQEIDSAPRSAAVTIARLRANRLRPTSCADGARFGAASRDAHSSARSEEHTSELQSLMRKSYAVFCLKQKKAK